ncbi:MAG: hypothetical protein M0R17_04495 [Candidatus Omnitrophica bacterium]|jgi:hypothetical protein|nr:hypothetical protein [Candidatus Omnitrophota bacterium]
MKPDVEALLRRHKKKFADNVIYSSEIENMIDELVQELGFGKMEIKRVLDSQFRILRETMNCEGLITEDSKFEDMKSIRLIRLGSFRPSPSKFEHIQEWIKNNKENDKKD